jgi:citrate lyase beta subunit
MKLLQLNTEETAPDLQTVPDQIGRTFSSQQEAVTWARNLVVSGYPAKRQGRFVWSSTEDLQPAAVKMVMRLGFEELDYAV